MTENGCTVRNIHWQTKYTQLIKYLGCSWSHLWAVLDMYKIYKYLYKIYKSHIYVTFHDSALKT